jgi:hypothetical protein
MERQRFWIHLTIGLTISMALTLANLASGSDAESRNSDGRGGLPPDRDSSSPLRGPSTVPQHMPSTGQTDETKTKKGTTEQDKSDLRASDNDGSAPRKHPSSHAEKHPDYERMDSQQQKTHKKESH